MPFSSLFLRGLPVTSALPTRRRKEANTSTHATDYLTRSVRRASCGFVLVANPDIVPKPARGRCRTVVPAALLVGQTLPFGAIAG